MALTIGLVGCTGVSAKLPEGDVKIVNQDLQGTVDLLKSSNYGGDKSTVASVVLPIN